MENLKEYLKKYLTVDGNPLYWGIYQGIRDLAERMEGDAVRKLPPIRKLAGELGINNGTVARAYGKLEEEGIVYTKTGSGTYLRNRIVLQDYMHYTNMEIDKNNSGRNLHEGNIDFIDFASSTPSSDFFPVLSFKKAINHVLDRDGGRAFGYQEEKGFYPLRKCICEYIAQMDIEADPEDILITTGAQQGIDLIAKVLIEKEDVIYMERPTYNGAAAAFLSRGAILVDVPMDGEGMNPNVFENMVKKKRPRFVYIMPDFQSPTGISYTMKRRKEILELAERYDFLLVEDDYLGELSFDDTIELRHLKSLDRYHRVIYVKSFSKLFMPGLRLGFMVLPVQIQKRMENAKWYSDISTSPLTQRAFEVYLRSGEWRVHLEELKKIYRIRHDVMSKVLSRYKGLFYFIPPRGGLTFWVSIAGEQFSLEVAARARENGVIITPGYRFYINGRDSKEVRLGYAAADEEEIEEGLERIVYSIKQ